MAAVPVTQRIYRTRKKWKREKYCPEAPMPRS